MWTDAIEKPTLLLDATKCRANLQRMADRVQRNPHVTLRPHAKTHQSAVLSTWWREEAAVTSITVSSVDMAAYFASEGGWNDITIAFTANPRQVDAMNRLLDRHPELTLGLLVESKDTLLTLQQQLQHAVKIWLDIDTGYHRTGLDWHDGRDEILALARATLDSPRTVLAGLLGHSGHTYDARGRDAVEAIHRETVHRMNAVRDMLQASSSPPSTDWSNLAISIGDTPTCSMVEDFGKVDEIRPGNLVFYDVMQANIGANTLEDIAVAVACPVVAKHEHLHQIVVYGGAVHLSKDRIVDDQGRTSFGRLARPTATGWQVLGDTCYVKGLSQEHGKIHADNDLLASVRVGDILLILPIHSCLTANLLKEYHLLTPTKLEKISMAPIPNVQSES